eukprot:scpid55110/ scgid19014/ 
MLIRACFCGVYARSLSLASSASATADDANAATGVYWPSTRILSCTILCVLLSDALHQLPVLFILLIYFQPPCTYLKYVHTPSTVKQYVTLQLVCNRRRMHPVSVLPVLNTAEVERNTEQQ